jgi:hypothetical protein
VVTLDANVPESLGSQRLVITWRPWVLLYAN